MIKFEQSKNRYVEVIKVTSKIGLIVLMIGIGVSLSGMLGFFIESESANKATMIGGLVLSAIGYILFATQNILTEDF